MDSGKMIFLVPALIFFGGVLFLANKSKSGTGK